MNRDDRLTLLARAWDEVASGYDAYFVPRFAPWLEEATGALEEPLPGGVLVVPCCGTGPELVPLAQAHPGREILGVDLSPGMVRRARQRVNGLANVTVQVADATRSDGWPPCAGVVSVFGLQQMPEPAVALAAWARALVAGGTLLVVYWLAEVELDGPFAWMAEVVASRLPPPSTTWESTLTKALDDAGVMVVRDVYLTHEMTHESPTSFWDAVLDSGPGRAMALAQGESFVREAREAFLERAPAGAINHQPRARHLVARREGASS